MGRNRQIYWVDLTRFDVKPDKSTWLEMGDALSRFGYSVSLTTSYAKTPFTSATHNVNFINIRPTRIPGLFRTALLFRTMTTLIKLRDRQGIYILPVAALFIAPVLKVFGLRNIHLDIRTVPVTVHGGKKKLDTIIFWKAALKLFANTAYSSSFITQALQEEVERESNTRFPRSCVWSSGVRTRAFEAMAARPESDYIYQFFYHGTITVDRGVIAMVEALEFLPKDIRSQVQLTVVGAGPGTAALVEVIAKKGMQDLVNYVGFVAYEDIAKYLRSASCCICPLPNRREWQLSSPLKVLEYMASAKPIIATPIFAHTNVLGNLPFVVWTEGFGEQAIAEAMATAYQDRDELSESAHSGPEFVRTHFDWEILGKRFAEHLDHCYG